MELDGMALWAILELSRASFWNILRKVGWKARGWEAAYRNPHRRTFDTLELRSVSDGLVKTRACDIGVRECRCVVVSHAFGKLQFQACALMLEHRALDSGRG